MALESLCLRVFIILSHECTSDQLKYPQLLSHKWAFFHQSEACHQIKFFEGSGVSHSFLFDGFIPEAGYKEQCCVAAAPSHTEKPLSIVICFSSGNVLKQDDHLPHS